jgi:hypothetical protein
MEASLFFWPSLCDILTGFGAAALLQFSALPALTGVFQVVIFGAGLSAVLFAHLCPRRPVPAWLGLCNATFALLVGLSLSLNVVAQLFPPRGKELALFLVYVLLCVPRVQPSRLALTTLAGMTAFVFVWFLVPASQDVRADRAEPLSGGELVAAFLTVFFACAFSPFDESSEAALLFHSARAHTLGVLIKAGALVLLGCLQRAQVYFFMFERANAAAPALQVCYGVLLLEACMLTAAVWFGHLRALLSRASNRVAVRMQHIIYALLLAAAWCYPLQLQLLRQLLVCLLLSANVSFRLTG